MQKKETNFSQKIDSSFAITIILLVAVVFVFIFWLGLEQQKISSMFQEPSPVEARAAEIVTTQAPTIAQEVLNEQERQDPVLSEVVAEDAAIGTLRDQGLEELNTVGAIDAEEFDL